jgi:hypothetical protein
MWRVSEKSRFKSDGQEDVFNSQLETLWPYKEVRYNVINSQSEIKKLEVTNLKLHPDQRPRHYV